MRFARQFLRLIWPLDEYEARNGNAQ
jgi:hypothetical protein